MEVAAPPETRNLGLKELDPQGTPAAQGVQEGRSGASQVLAAIRVQARQRGFGAQGAFVPLAQLGHSLNAICQKSGFIQTQLCGWEVQRFS